RHDRADGSAMAKNVVVVANRVGGEGRDGDTACRHDREIGDGPFRAVLGDQCHPFARCEADHDQTGSQPAHLAGGPGIILPAPGAIGFRLQMRPSGMALSLLEEHLWQALPRFVGHPVSAKPWPDGLLTLYRPHPPPAARRMRRLWPRLPRPPKTSRPGP